MAANRSVVSRRTAVAIAAEAAAIPAQAPVTHVLAEIAVETAAETAAETDTSWFSVRAEDGVVTGIRVTGLSYQFGVGQFTGLGAFAKAFFAYRPKKNAASGEDAGGANRTGEDCNRRLYT